MMTITNGRIMDAMIILIGLEATKRPGLKKEDLIHLSIDVLKRIKKLRLDCSVAAGAASTSEFTTMFSFGWIVQQRGSR